MLKCRSKPDGSGDHSSEHLQVIYEDIIDDFSSAVVRWCSVCGAIVVDMEYDRRLRPGAIRAMKFPNYERRSLDRSLEGVV